MQLVQAIAKKDRNEGQKFNFRGIDAVMNAVGPAFRATGLVCIPHLIDSTQEWFQTDKQKNMKGVTVTIRYTIHGPAGDNISGVVQGEAADVGDKAVSKAHSVALRTFLLQALCIPTDEPDPDLTAVDRGSPVKQPPALMDEGLHVRISTQLEEASTVEELKAAWDTMVELQNQGKVTDVAYAQYSTTTKRRRGELSAPRT